MVDHAETLAGEGQSRFPGWYHFRRRGDLHQKCQGCRTKEGGKICSRTDTCAVCHSWSPREWDALDAAIALSIRRCTNRSQSKEGTVTHQEDVLTLEPEEDTDFNDNKKTKSGKGEMSESLPSRFPEDRGESPLPWDVPRDSTSGEKPSVVVGDSMFYGEDMNGNRVETARSSMERPVQSHTIGVDSGHPAKGSDAGHPVTGVWCQAPGNGVWCQAPVYRVWCWAIWQEVRRWAPRADSAATNSVQTDGTGLTGRSVPEAGSRMAHAVSGWPEGSSGSVMVGTGQLVPAAAPSQEPGSSILPLVMGIQDGVTGNPTAE